MVGVREGNTHHHWAWEGGRKGVGREKAGEGRQGGGVGRDSLPPPTTEGALHTSPHCNGSM